MTIEQYRDIIVKQWKIVIICFLFTGLATFLVSKLMTPIYQSSALVQVSISSINSQADYNNLLASDQLVQTETQLATSDPVLREVAGHYPDLTVDQLSKEVSATSKLNTQLFQISVQDASPKRSAVLANDIAATLIRQQQQAMQQKNIQAQRQIQADLTNTRQQIDTITTEIAAISGQQGKGSQVVVLQAQLNGLQQHYSQWQNALAQLELTQAQGVDFLMIAQQAQPPLHPIKPNVLLNTAAGFLAGLFLGILLAVVFVQLDTRMRSAEELAKLLGWPALSTIWNAQASRGETIINPSGHNANSEAYRMLRSSIGFSSIDKPMHTLLVTSPIPGDGKSVIAANLAIFMAKAGKKTLLIDADLHRPTLHKKFGLSADLKGLSHAILAFSTSTSDSTPSQLTGIHSNMLLNPFVHSINIPNLLVMPAGALPPNPTELLESKAMQRLLAVLAQSNIETIIFDTPPLLVLSDASILAARVDGTLLVVDISRAKKAQAKQSQALLTQAGANVLGCVINKQTRPRKDMSYSYYYQADGQKEEAEQNEKESETSIFSDTLPILPAKSINTHK